MKKLHSFLQFLTKTKTHLSLIEALLFFDANTDYSKFN